MEAEKAEHVESTLEKEGYSKKATKEIAKWYT